MNIGSPREISPRTPLSRGHQGLHTGWFGAVKSFAKRSSIAQVEYPVSDTDSKFQDSSGTSNYLAAHLVIFHQGTYFQGRWAPKAPYFVEWGRKKSCREMMCRRP